MKRRTFLTLAAGASVAIPASALALPSRLTRTTPKADWMEIATSLGDDMSGIMLTEMFMHREYMVWCWTLRRRGVAEVERFMTQWTITGPSAQFRVDGGDLYGPRPLYLHRSGKRRAERALRSLVTAENSKR